MKIRSLLCKHVAANWHLTRSTLFRVNRKLQGFRKNCRFQVKLAKKNKRSVIWSVPSRVVWRRNKKHTILNKTKRILASMCKCSVQSSTRSLKVKPVLRLLNKCSIRCPLKWNLNLLKNLPFRRIQWVISSNVGSREIAVSKWGIWTEMSRSKLLKCWAKRELRRTYAKCCSLLWECQIKAQVLNIATIKTID